MLKPVARSAVASLAALSLVLPDVVPALGAVPLSRADYEACQARDEQGFQAAVETLTKRALHEGTAGFDYRGAVGDEWRRLGISALIDQEADAAVNKVVEETSWGSLLQSLADSKKAEELAIAVAERVYRSEPMKAALEQLAAGVSKSVGQRIEAATERAAGPIVGCLQAYLGTRYGTAVARIVAADAANDLGAGASKTVPGAGSGAVLRQSGGGIAGVAILLVRRQLANMAGRVGRRLVGSVLSRLVSVAAGGIGLVLIAKDLWDLRHGVMPIIAEEMKSPSAKEKVQDELAKGIEEEINSHLDQIGVQAAAHILEVWREFRRAHAKVLDLAEANAPFKAFVDRLNPDTLPRLDEVVSIILGTEGEEAVLKRLGDGSLDEAVRTFSAPAMDIARQQRSLETGLSWVRLAGPDIGKVADLGLYQRTSPAALDRAALTRLLALDDRLAVTRLAGVRRDVREILFELDQGRLKSLARQLAGNELETFARYLTHLEITAQERVLSAAAADPSKMHILASAHVRDAIIASRDQSAAVGIMVRADGLFEPRVFVDDARMVWDGRVHPVLLWEKHPGSVTGLAAAFLIVLLWLRRLVTPRRR